MKKHIAAAALALLGFNGAAQAALVTLNTEYKVSFASLAIESALALPTGSSVFVQATFDDANVVDNAVTISPTDSFLMTFGNQSFNAASDLLGAPVVQTVLGSSGLAISGLLFETLFNITSGAATGEYLLSFSGTSFQLTPSGDTTDFVATGVHVVPLPATLPLLLTGMGLLTMYRRRQK